MTEFETRAKDVFLDALERDAAARAAFLDAACVGDAKLRARVESLLRGHDTAEHALPAAVSELTPGARIDRYVLKRALGEGGFGIVFLAEQQEPIRREVALKIVKLGMDTQRVIARFERERQTLASMDHPAIARVYDAGVTASGRPYFVMERVHGAPITQYCEARKLDLRQRLTLFKTVCRAIEHAHQRGVIHRDIKPSNVLVGDVDGEPAPKVIDFGIAKAMQDETGEARSIEKHVIGTLSAMSPEQLRGAADLDTRTDVYALGVLLYQLCTGTVPFDPDALGHDAFATAVLDRDPPRPSSCAIAALTPVPRDVDWIVLRCLEKDRERRYAGAAALADDIDRWLQHEPILAAPPSASYRIRKFVRRHRVASLATVAVLGALVGGAITTRLQMIEARRQEHIARAVNEFLTHDLLPALRPSDRPGRGREVTLRAVLDAAAQKLDADAETGGRFHDEPLVEASVRASIGKSYAALGLYPAALPHLERARELFVAEEGPGSGRGIDATLDSAGVLRNVGRAPEAVAALRAVLPVLRAGGAGARVNLINAIEQLALTLSNLGARDEVKMLCQEALTLVPDDDDADHQITRSNLAIALARVFESDEPRALFRRALEVMRRLCGPDDPHVLMTTFNYVASLDRQESREEALGLLEDLIPRQRAVFGDEHPETIAGERQLGEFRLDADRVDEADALFTHALAASRRVHGDKHPSTLTLLGAMSRVREQQGRVEEAEALTREALRIAEETYGEKHVLVVAFLNDLASELLAQHKDDELEPTLRRALNLAEQVFGADHPNTAVTRENLVNFLKKRDRDDEAAAIERK